MRHKNLRVVSDYKDTNFWKQFTTSGSSTPTRSPLFQTTKIQTFESNSQRPPPTFSRAVRLFQTTKIQTFESNSQQPPKRVWLPLSCFRLQRYKLLKAIHNARAPHHRTSWVVSDYKDTNFWKQFTTRLDPPSRPVKLFQTTKIQTFESNSQRAYKNLPELCSCFRLQRYKLLKAIHNRGDWGSWYLELFQTTKIQTFESNSQPEVIVVPPVVVVSDYKDTNFWKQFTTRGAVSIARRLLFQTTKIQTFESNSQRPAKAHQGRVRCFRLQRYKLLKAIHNLRNSAFP